jgi:drug/metabolite transporter (DMT)-like permease|tara:strand:+ start:709 stop:1614 length:906 start_codon:yes stop_codon:yes gene_type:complete
MPLWIPITIAAAFLQNLRSALQRQLARDLTATSATYVRFLFGLPVAIVYLWVLLATLDVDLSAPPPEFYVYAVLGGVAQIIGTVLLVALFAHRNFVVGTTYSKTETVQTALFGILVFGETITLGAGIGIAVSLVGVIAISMARTEASPSALITSLTERAALMGIGSGAAYGVAAVCYRAGSLSLGMGGFLVPAAITLAVVLTIQTLLMTGWLLWKDKTSLMATLKNWPASLAIGVAGALGSIGWFTAMTLQNAAYVRALGQIELVFTFAVSWIWFREQANAKEIAGVLLIIGGLIVLILGT